MAGITGLGGVFIQSQDPKALAAWYQEKLGVNFGGSTYAVMPFPDKEAEPNGFNIFSFAKKDDPYFAPSKGSAMLNLRVSGLVEFLEELKGKGVEIVGDMVDGEYGKFGWVMDPDGNKVELWEPPA